MKEWDDYSDEYGQDAEYENFDNWEVRINDEVLDVYETKENALWSLLEEIDSDSNNELFKGVKLVGYSDENEMYKVLSEMCAEDFYSQLEIILETFDIKDNYKLVNLDNEEPEFGEL